MTNNKLWFRAKRYGWGWVPCTWEGWLTVLVFVVLMVWDAKTFAGVKNSTNSQLAWFLIRTAFLVAALLYVCYEKGEKGGWRWGNKKITKD